MGYKIHIPESQRMVEVIIAVDSQLTGPHGDWSCNCKQALLTRTQGSQHSQETNNIFLRFCLLLEFQFTESLLYFYLNSAVGGTILYDGISMNVKL